MADFCNRVPPVERSQLEVRANAFNGHLDDLSKDWRVDNSVAARLASHSFVDEYLNTERGNTNSAACLVQLAQQRNDQERLAYAGETTHHRPAFIGLNAVQSPETGKLRSLAINYPHSGGMSVGYERLDVYLADDKR
jgi:hypothetical protein